MAFFSVDVTFFKMIEKHILICISDLLRCEVGPPATGRKGLFWNKTHCLSGPNGIYCKPISWCCGFKGHRTSGVPGLVLLDACRGSQELFEFAEVNFARLLWTNCCDTFNSRPGQILAEPTPSQKVSGSRCCHLRVAKPFVAQKAISRQEEAAQ